MKVNPTRSDYWFLWLVLAGMVVQAAVGPVWLLVQWAAGRSLVWPNAAPDHTVAPVLAESSDAVVRWSVDATEWEIVRPIATQWLGALLPGLLVLAVTVWLCVLAYRFTKLIGVGRPFGSGAHRLLMWGAAALTTLTVVAIFGELIANMLIIPAPAPTSFALLQLDAGDFLPLLVAMLLVVVAQAWRHGERLQSDDDATI